MHHWPLAEVYLVSECHSSYHCFLFVLSFFQYIVLLSLVLNRQSFKGNWQPDEEDNDDSREIMLALNLCSTSPSLHLSPSLLCCSHVVISSVFMFFNPF